MKTTVGMIALMIFLAGISFAQRGGRQSPMDASAFNNPTLAHTDVEKRILAVLKDLDKNNRRGNMNVPVEDGRLLRLLTETTNAQNVVEMGTSNGYSGLWILMGLQTTGGHLTTFEIDDDRAAQARANFKRADLEKDVTLIFGDAHKTLTTMKLDGPIDILFLDADKAGYIDYLKQLMPQIRPGGLILAHNMTTNLAHPPFVKFITENPELETLFLHMEGAGMSVTMKKR